MDEINSPDMLKKISWVSFYLKVVGKIEVKEKLLLNLENFSTKIV